MKRVLLTNAFIKNYSGSELDTVEIANYFFKNGYSVDIFTLEKGEPLLSEINKDIRVLTYKDIKKLHKKYDILWSHHFPLVDYLIFNTNIQFDYIHHVCLSFYEAYEQLPLYYKDLNLVSAMSSKCRDGLVSNTSEENKNILVFPNYAKMSYFNKNKKISKTIKKIAIVSNHIPEELLKFQNIMEQKQIKVDIYGQGYHYVKIDEKILLDYDVIISIGKTCYYSVALGIPTYVYDHFGGDGYLIPTNIEESFNNNFSGRAFRRKLSATQLAKEIIEEYPNAITTIPKCKEFGFKNFCFEKNMENSLNQLYKMPKFNKERVLEQYPQLIKTGKLFVEQVGTCKDEIENLKDAGLKSCQLFYDTGIGFNEKESIRSKSTHIGRNDYEVEFTLKSDCQRIRFDICEKALVEIRNITMNKKKISYAMINVVAMDNTIISFNKDPYIIIDKPFKKNDKVNFRYELIEVEPSDILNQINVLANKGKMQQQEIEKLTIELNSIKNSKFYKLAKKIHKIIKRR